MFTHNFSDYDSSDTLTRHSDVQNQTEVLTMQGQGIAVNKKLNTRTIFIGGRKQTITAQQYNNIQARLKAREEFTKDLKRETPCLFGGRNNLAKVTKSNFSSPAGKDLSKVETRHAIREGLAGSRKEQIEKQWSNLTK
jgi:hypothetical protein